jgi:hypothetical protein
MENAKCLLCGHDAEIGAFTEAEPDEHDRVNVAGGFKYDCPECGFYALDGYEHHFVEHRATEAQKKKLADWVKSHPNEKGNYKVLKWREIEKILNLPPKKKTKTADYYKELSKCPKGGLHSLWKREDMEDWQCRKCKRFFTKEDSFIMDRE